MRPNGQEGEFSPSYNYSDPTRAPRLSSALKTSAAWCWLPGIAMAVSLGVSLPTPAQAQTAITSGRSVTLQNVYTTGSPFYFTVASGHTITPEYPQSHELADIEADGSRAWTIHNAGTLSTNTYNGSSGIYIHGAAVIVNSGTAGGHYSSQSGIILNSGSIDNTSSGVLIGGSNGYGIQIKSGVGTITNDGTIKGYGGGIELEGGGTITNTGVIKAENEGVKAFGGVTTIINSGYIGRSSQSGIYIQGDGNFIETSGTIAGFNDIIEFKGGSNTLKIDPGAVFVGGGGGQNGIESEGSGNLLEFGSSTNTGTIASFSDFSAENSSFGQGWNIQVDSGANWVFNTNGTAKIFPGNAFTNEGTATFNGTLELGGGFTNSGGNGIQFGSGDDTFILDGYHYHSFASVVADGGAGINTVGYYSQITATNGLSSNTNFTHFQKFTVEHYSYLHLLGSSYLAGAAVLTNYGKLYTSGGTFTAAGVINNHKTVVGGLTLESEGQFNNLGGAVITGEVYGSGIGVTISNAGAFTQTGTSVNLSSSTNDFVFINTGASFSGTVVGGGSTDTVELVTGNGGTLSNLFSNFGSLKADSAAAWVLNNNDTFANIYSNNGTLTNAGTLTSTGTFFANGTVVNAGKIVGNSGTAIQFGTGADVLQIKTGASFSGVADGGAGTDTVELVTGNGGTLTGTFNHFEVLQNDASSNWVINNHPTFATLINAGTINLSSYRFYLNTYLNNQAGGTITSTGGVGLETEGGTTVALNNEGLIQGSGHGIFLIATGGTLTNSGTIKATSTAAYTYGVTVYPSGNITVTNSAGGLISGSSGGVQFDKGNNELVNAGTIIQTGTVASGAGVVFYHSHPGNDTLINSGTIIGTGGTAVLFTSGSDLLQIETGAVFTGLIDGGGGTDTVEFVTGNGGTFANTIINFETLTVDSGAQWVLAGNNTFANIADNSGGVTNTGTLTSTSGFTASGTLINSGTIIGNSGTAVQFGSGGDLLQLNTGAYFSGLVDGGAGTNVLELVSGNGGTLSNAFTNFATANVDAGASWVLAGNDTFTSVSIANLGTLANAGTLTASVTDAGSLSNSGVINGTVTLGNTGILSNLSGGTIIGATAVKDGFNNVNINNAGTITSTGTAATSAAIYLSGSGTVTNHGTIAAANIAIFDNLSAATLSITNYGVITASGGGYTIEDAAGNNTINLTNESGATISATGTRTAVRLSGLITNQGVINSGSLGEGVALFGGSINNSGTISGGYGVLATLAAVNITNSGSIKGSAHAGIKFGNFTDTLSNSGYIGAASGSSVTFGTADDVLNVYTGASFHGAVDGGSGTDTVNFVTGNGGTLSNNFSNFETATVAGLANWVLSGNDTFGTLTVNGTLTNAGTITASVDDAGILSNSGKINGNVQLASGGSLTNTGTITGVGYGVDVLASQTFTNGGSIDASGYGVAFQNGGVLINNGTITGSIYGVYNELGGLNIANAGSIGGGIKITHAGGTVTNGSSANGTAQISGGPAVYITGGAGAVTNFGTIIASSGYGVSLKGGGSVSNLGTGSISGVGGIYATAAISTVTNAGSIAGGSGLGVYLRAGGTVINGGTANATARISSSNDAVSVANATGIIHNYGTLYGATGVYLGAGGTIINSGTAALIRGASSDGIKIAGSSNSTITNSGYINSGNGRGIQFTGSGNNTVINYGAIYASVGNDAILFGSGNDTLEVGNGASFYGAVDGGGGTNTLAFLTNTSGTVSGFTNFQNITVYSGADWTVSGSDTIASGATLNNQGTFQTTGQLIDQGLITNSGTLNEAFQVTGTGSLNNSGQIASGTAYTVYTNSSAVLTNSGTIANTHGNGGIAIEFHAATSVFNSGTAALISGANGVKNTSGAYLSLTNQGTITGLADIGVYSMGGLYLNNSGSLAHISGVNVGVDSDGFHAGTVINTGTIQGTGTNSIGVQLYDGGSVTNNSSHALISGGYAGVDIESGGLVTNFGTILTTGNDRGGVFLRRGGTIHNYGSASYISDHNGGGVYVGGTSYTATVINQGTIKGAVTGEGTAIVTNGNAGFTRATIGGAGYEGISVGNLTLTNYGTITGGVYSYGTGSGLVTNSGTAALIQNSSGYGISINASGGSVSNAGSISGGSDGVYLSHGGTVTNTSAASFISGGNSGVRVNNAAGIINNSGTITGTGRSGVYLTQGGTVTNAGTASKITGQYIGVEITNAAGTVINDGTIATLYTGGYGRGVKLRTGAVINHAGGQISGDTQGVYAYRGVITNDGTISNSGAGGTGVYILDSGTIINGGTSSAALITGHVGVYVGNVTDTLDSTITNYGTIIGSSGQGILFSGTLANTVINGGTIIGASGHDAIQFGSGDDLLTLVAGAKFTGVVDGGGGNNTLAFGGTSAGTFTGLGSSSFVNFGAVAVNSGATWSLTGANTVASGVTLSNAGTLTNAGTLLNAGSIANTGSFYDSGLLTNTSTFSGGLLLAAAGSLNNSGQVTSSGYAISSASGSSPNVTNSGTIHSSGSGAVTFVNGGAVNNSTTLAQIIGAAYGVLMAGAAGTLLNSGTITGGTAAGVKLGAGGSVTNSGTASYIKGTVGVTGVGVTVTNAGRILGSSGAGISFASGNNTVINSGTIAGASGQDAILFGSGNDTMEVETGAVFTGNVDGGSGVNTLEFLSGTISPSAYFTNFGIIAVSSGAGGVLNAFTNAATLTNSGTLINNAGLSNNATFNNAGYFRTTESVTNNVSISNTGTFLNDGHVTNAGTGVFTSSGTLINDTGFGGNTLTLTNNAVLTNHGNIYGAQGVFAASGSNVQITNTSTITGTTTNGIYLYSAGTVTNSGIITGHTTGVYAYDGAGTSIINTGTIIGSTVTGVFLDSGGSVANNGSASSIHGQQYGVEITTGAGTVSNAGTITGGLAGKIGVLLTAGGSVSNTGTITGNFGGVAIAGGGTVANYGNITASGNGNNSSYRGVYLHDGGTILNKGTVASIFGYSFGVNVSGGAGTVVNTGSIGSSYYAVRLNQGGNVTNGSTGTNGTAASIYGANFGIQVYGAAGIVTNYGTILGTNDTGVVLAAGGTITNIGSASLIQGYDAISGSSGTTIVNAGTILATGGSAYGISLTGGSNKVINTGAIQAQGDAITFGGTLANTVINGGTIIAGGSDAVLFGSGNDRLELMSGYSFTGVVDGAGGTNTLEFVTGAASLSGLGTEFLNFQVVQVDSGASLALGGDTIAAGYTVANAGSLSNTGTFTVDGGFTNTGTFTNTGSIAVASTGTLSSSGIFTNSGTIIASGTGSAGITVTGGTLTNAAGGVIQGGKYGALETGGTIINSGTIEDPGVAGESLGSNAVLVNQAAGLVTGTIGALFTGTGASLTNYGTITGTSGVAIQFDAGSNTATFGTGSVLNGTIDGGAGAGKINLIGTNSTTTTIANFGAGSVLTIASGANWTASGQWTIASVSNAGTLQAGVAGTPLKLTGNFAQTSAGTLNTVLTASGGSSEVIVTGTAALAGKVAITSLPAITAATKYTLVSATGGVSGTFSSVTGGTALLIPTLSYDANDAFVTVTQQSVAQGGGTGTGTGGTTTTTQAAINSFTETRNEFAVATAFDAGRAANKTGFASALAGLDTLTASGVTSSLDRLAGENNADLSTAALLADRQLIGAFHNHAAQSRDSEQRLNIWAVGFGQNASLGGDGNTHTLDEVQSGVDGGVDYAVVPGLRVGALFGYSTGHFNVAGGNGAASVQSTQYAITEEFTDDALYINALGGAGTGVGKTVRDVSLPGLPATATGRGSNRQAIASVEAGYKLAASDAISLTPFASLNYGSVGQHAFSETGAGTLDLAVASKTSTATQSILGTRISTGFALGNLTIDTSAKFGWSHEFTTARLANESFAGTAGTGFTVAGASLPGDSAVLGLGLSTALGDGFSAYADYDGQIGNNASSQAFSLGVRLGW